jgi:two-component system, NtrC family, sensor kinase
MIVAALVPLGIAGLLVDSIARNEVVDKIDQLFTRTSQSGARHILNYVQDTIVDLTVAVGYLEFDSMNAAEKSGALRMLYSQFPSINIITLFGPDNEPAVNSVYLTDPAAAGGVFADHQPVDRNSLNEYADRLPLQSAMAEGLPALSEVYLTADAKLPAVAAVIPFSPTEQGQVWALAIEITLAPLQNELEDFLVGRNSQVMVVDSQRRRILHASHAINMSTDITPVGSNFDPLFESQQPNLVAKIEDDRAELIAASVAIKELGWHFIISQPEDIAYRCVHGMRNQLLFWLVSGALLAMILGYGFSKTISQPILECSAMATKLGGGNLLARVHIDSRDEIGILGKNLNFMGQQLDKSHKHIQAQNIELRGWNEELEQRVTERTAQLKKLQAQLLQAQKMAAIGDLGAGIAHELNNPMVGILGLTQLVIEKMEPDSSACRSLKAVEKEALRCRQIIADLLAFSQGGGGQERIRCNFNSIIKRSIGLTVNQYNSEGIAIEDKLEALSSTVLADAGGLEQVILQLFSNAKNAMPSGGSITAETSNPEPELIELVVRDTGKGIAPENITRVFEPFFTTKDNWSGKGLGLSVAYTLIQEHNGEITVESNPGEGAVFTILLPTVRSTQLV